MDSDASAYEVDASDDYEAPKPVRALGHMHHAHQRADSLQKAKAPAKKAAAAPKPKAAPRETKLAMTKAATAPKAKKRAKPDSDDEISDCLLYTSPSPRDGLLSRMPSSA